MKTSQSRSVELATDVTALSHGYTGSKRFLDIASILVFFVLEAAVVFRALPYVAVHPWTTLFWLVIGYIAADFMSGLVHWIGDTWGDPSMPVVGQYFIRPFREHHVDQTAITRHDFVQTNGANCLATVVVLLPTVLLAWSSQATWVNAFFVFIFAMTVGVFGTNQFHKWSHLSSERRPWIIRWLQSGKLILDPVHHSKHHAAPYNTYYCITVGWLNPILAKMKFFQGVEWLVTKVTGALPRKNDIVLTASKAVQAVTTLENKLETKIGGVIGEVKDGVTEVIGEMREGVTGVVHEVKDGVSGVIQEVSDSLPGSHQSLRHE